MNPPNNINFKKATAEKQAESEGELGRDLDAKRSGYLG